MVGPGGGKAAGFGIAWAQIGSSILRIAALGLKARAKQAVFRRHKSAGFDIFIQSGQRPLKASYRGMICGVSFFQLG